MYPVVITNAERVLHCTDIAGTMRLEEDYATVCSGSEYEPLRITAILFTTVVAVGVPGLLFLTLRRHHGVLDRNELYEQLFFMFGEFKEDWYWWEVTVLVRKVLMGCIAVLLSGAGSTVGMQVYTATWVLLISFTAQVACLPHRDTFQRMLETWAQAAVLASLVLGQGIQLVTSAGAASERTAMVAATVTLNVVTMGGMLAIFVRELWTEAKTHLRNKRVSRKTQGSVVTLEMHSLDAAAVPPATSTMNPMFRRGPI